MKRLLFYFLVFAFPTITNAQIEETEILHFAIKKYINLHYDTTSKQIVYIEILHEKARYSLKYGDISVCILDDTKHKYILNKALKTTNGYYHTLSIKRFGNDTIDYVFCRCQVKKIGKYFQVIMESGGDAGYIPFVRFVNTDMNGKWNYYLWQELLHKSAQIGN